MMNLSASTKVAGVIGDPVRHSLSPAIHNAAFRSGGLDWVLCAFPVPAGDPSSDGERILDAMQLFGIEGLAVTTPHKNSVAAALATRDIALIDPAAQALSSVNTLTRAPDGQIHGASTDGEGFVASLQASGVDLTQAKVALSGAGAAARSVVDALSRTAVAEIAIINRSAPAAVVAAALSPVARVATLAEVAEADIVINATTIGMGNTPTGTLGDTPVPGELLRAGQVVTDLVYHPLETRLLSEARAIGAHVVDGLGMLIHQAALQQLLWTGTEPDVGAMRQAAETELAARRR
jgi:shikimate dehydrogenase